MNACCAVDEPGRVYSTGEIRDWLASPGVDPRSDLFVAIERETLVGQSMAWKQAAAEFVDVAILLDLHPDYRERGRESVSLGHALLDRTEARARQLVEGETLPCSLVVFVLETQHYQLYLLKERGYRPIRYFWKMVLKAGEQVRLPSVPPGIILRTLDRESDSVEELTELRNASLEGHWRMHEITVEEMAHFLDSPKMREEFYLLAEADGRLIGNCISVINDDGSAWVEDLGVVKAFRGRGIGKALFAAGVTALRQAGVTDDIFLNVDGENPSEAKRLYEGAGFTECSMSTVYQKAL